MTTPADAIRRALAERPLRAHDLVRDAGLAWEVLEPELRTLIDAREVELDRLGRYRLRRAEDDLAGCVGKERYETEGAARSVVRQLLKRRRRKQSGRRHARMDVYRCLICSTWHIGNGWSR